MAKVLTMGSIVNCGILGLAPPLHGGIVSVDSKAKLKVNGNPVLLKTSIKDQVVKGCLTPTDTQAQTQPCVKVLSVVTGEAKKLKVNGQWVMLDTVTGTTNGVPIGTLSGTAIQTKLTAI